MADHCEICNAPQYILPNGTHYCGDQEAKELGKICQKLEASAYKAAISPEAPPEEMPVKLTLAEFFLIVNLIANRLQEKAARRKEMERKKGGKR